MKFHGKLEICGLHRIPPATPDSPPPNRKSGAPRVTGGGIDKRRVIMSNKNESHIETVLHWGRRGNH